MQADCIALLQLHWWCTCRWLLPAVPRGWAAASALMVGCHEVCLPACLSRCRRRAVALLCSPCNPHPWATCFSNSQLCHPGNPAPLSLLDAHAGPTAGRPALARTSSGRRSTTTPCPLRSRWG